MKAADGSVANCHPKRRQRFQEQGEYGPEESGQLPESENINRFASVNLRSMKH